MSYFSYALLNMHHIQYDSVRMCNGPIFIYFETLVHFNIEIQWPLWAIVLIGVHFAMFAQQFYVNGPKCFNNGQIKYINELF